MNRRQFLGTTAAAAAMFPSGVSFAAGERRWRIGVIGHTGRGNFGHGLHTLWLGLPGTEIVGLADPDDAGRAAAHRGGIVQPLPAGVEILQFVGRGDDWAEQGDKTTVAKQLRNSL